MEKKWLIVVDMQNDFVNGVLGTKEAQDIVPYLVDKVKNFDGEIMFTMDTHPQDYLTSTQEGKFLPIPHCIKGSKGWELIDELKEYAPEYCKIIKPTFGSIDLAKKLIKETFCGQIESIELCGVCTDICVVSNALLLKAFLPNVPSYVDAKACAGVTPEKHEAALEVMRSCQINVISRENKED